MSRTREKALWVASEGSDYGIDPDTDGSDYLAVPCHEIGELADGLELLETTYQNGRNFPTAPVVGRDGWSFEFTTPLIGLAPQGDGDNPNSVDDWLELLLHHVFGQTSSKAGAEITASTTSQVTTTQAAAVGELVCVRADNLTKANWRRVTGVATNARDVAPDLDANPSGNEVAAGYQFFDPTDTGGRSLAFAYRDPTGTIYTCLGGRVTGLTIVAELGQIVRCNFQVSGDSYETGGKGSLPAAATAPVRTPIKAVLSPFEFNGTAYTTRRLELDLGVNAREVASTAAAQGRADFDNIDLQPMLTVEPLRADAQRQLRRDQTSGGLVAQLGGGSSGNTVAVLFGNATMQEYSPSDDEGRARNTLQFKAFDNGTGIFVRLHRA